MSIITPERAGAIRGELCAKYDATWLHHYHEAIEAEVLRELGITAPAPGKQLVLVVEHLPSDDSEGGLL